MLKPSREHEINYQIDFFIEFYCNKWSSKLDPGNLSPAKGPFQWLVKCVPENDGALHDDVGHRAAGNVLLQKFLYVQEIGEFGHENALYLLLMALVPRCSFSGSIP